MKRILSLLLTLCMISGVLTAIPMTASAATSGTCGDDLTWSLDDEGTLTISGTGDMYDYTWSDETPWYRNRGSIKNIILENGVTAIGTAAFSGQSNATNVLLPETVTKIGANAFSGCNDLTNIIIPKNVADIGQYAFDGCFSLKNIDVADGNNFYCSDKNGVLYNKNKSTLLLCPVANNVKNFIVPDTVATIDHGAFANHSTLTSIFMDDGVEFIGAWAFERCPNLIEISMPDSLTTIASNAFYECNGLTSLTIPENVVTIAGYAFYGCKNLTKIYWNAKHVNDFSSSNHNFAQAGQLGTGVSVVFGDNVEYIPSYAFYPNNTAYASSRKFNAPKIAEVIFSNK